MADVFVSYARGDEGRVEPLVAELEKRGWSVFWDQSIATGEQWRNTIGEALREARCVVVAWTRMSIGKFWVAEEAEFARKRGTLVPALLDDVEPPIGFQGIQVADLTDWSPDQHTPASERFFRDIEVLIQRGSNAVAVSAGPTATSLRASPTTRGAVRSRGMGRKSFIASAVAALALLVGGFLALRARTPTLETAMHDLASANSDERLQAIHELGILARASEANRGPALGALAQFVRTRAPWRPNVVRKGVERDVQAALTLIGQLPKRGSASDKPARLDMHNVDISGAKLENADLEAVVLWGSNLRGAVLSRADLRDADLGGVDFTDASLEMADLRGAKLWPSDVADPRRACILARTRMGGAMLDGADLGGAILTTALGLDAAQLQLAKTDPRTRVPEAMQRPRARPPRVQAAPWR